MKRNAVIGLAAAVLAVIVVWYLVIYSPKADELTTVKADVATEAKKTQDLESQLAQLNEQKKNASQQEALLNKFDAAIPEQPDLGEFIIQANNIADSSGVDFMSVAPSPPAASGTTTVIALSISIQGGFFQVKDYLSQLESLERLVIVDGIKISAGSSAEGTSADGVTLSVTVTGRMFTRAQPAGAAGATPTAPDSTTTTTPGASSGSSSTVPSGSSTTGGT
jgi:Tfp pilus assembly protein PilO